MFFEVSSLTYHSPITIGLLTYRVLLGTLTRSSSGRTVDDKLNRSNLTLKPARGATRPSGYLER
jgi:hypothetical protein